MLGKIVGRDPAITAGSTAAGAQLATAYLVGLSPQLQSIITAIIVAALGLYVAYKTGDGIKAALLGTAQAVFSLFSYYGLEWSAETQSKILGTVAFLFGMWVHDRVTAPVGPEVSPPGKLVE